MNRKKSICFLTSLLLTVCLVLSACDPGMHSFDYSELRAEVIGVSLIEYNNPAQKRMLNLWPKWARYLAKFDSTQVTVLEELDIAQQKDFCIQLATMPFIDDYNTDSPRGKCLMLTCKNGDFLILSPGGALNNDYPGYIGRYESDGTPIEAIGTFASSNDCQLLFAEFFSSL